MAEYVEKKRSYRIDCLKAIAIIAICLYHVGGGISFRKGYLGVEIFLPVSGYFMMNGILNRFDEKGFSARGYMVKQLKRLWPPVLCGVTVALIVGYFVMLPDNFENLAESVIASSVFVENVLEAITTKNYWDIVNLYKPLMHLWYIGVLVQVQFALALIFSIVIKMKNETAVLRNVVVVLTLISLALYLCPAFSDADKFYFPWFRAYEILLGSLVAFLSRKRKLLDNKPVLKAVSCLVPLLMIVMLFGLEVGGGFDRIIIVLCTCFLLLYYSNSQEHSSIVIKGLAKIGEVSYSIYIVHQIIVAYMYYCVVEQFSYTILPVYFITVAITASIMYFVIEKGGWSILRRKKLACSIVMCALLITISFVIYVRAGVVKDVPELDISANKYHRGMHAEYCDEPYKYNRDFQLGNKEKVLVVGNSFGRDWVNILRESKIADDIEISYLPYHSKKNLEGNETVLQRRANDSDIIFFVLGPDYRDIPDCYLQFLPMNKLFVVGNKNFGKSNGIIYCRRNRDDYLNSIVELDVDLIENNLKMSKKYGGRFIDVLGYVMVSNTQVKVFTDEGKFISQDCRHLTQNGAKFLASRIAWDDIFGGKDE